MCPLTVTLSLPDRKSQNTVQLGVKIYLVIKYKVSTSIAWPGTQVWWFQTRVWSKEKKNLVSAAGDFLFLSYIYLLRSSQAGKHLWFGNHRFPQEHTQTPRAYFWATCIVLGAIHVCYRGPNQGRRGEGRVGVPSKGRWRWCPSPCVILYEKHISCDCDQFLQWTWECLVD